MATGTFVREDEPSYEQSMSRVRQVAPALETLLRPLASMRLTVVLFAFLILLVLMGTLAQARKDIWQVIHEYFRVNRNFGLAWIEVRDLFPPAWLQMAPRWVTSVAESGVSFPFPSGTLIGIAMAINLLAAHLIRFKIQARGSRLVAGLWVSAVGAAAAVLLLWAGSLQDGAAPWLFVRFPWLRISWYLSTCSIVSLLLLAGCVLLFKKRSGIVLLHAGVGLMMVGELLVYLHAKEAQMHVREGETSNFVSDTREVELAIVDHSPQDHDDVVVIPRDRLISRKSGQARGESEAKTSIHDGELPFQLEMVKYLVNSDLRRATGDDENPATRGRGLGWLAVDLKPGVGADNKSSIDFASAYVKIVAKSGQEIGTYLLSTLHSQQDDVERVTVDGKTYDVSLRFKRSYRPYSFHLVDVRKDDYIGTDTPRNYSSDFRLVDPTRSVDRSVKIWMNNPLRFAGETFYQSNFVGGVQEATGVQVVTNTGWMIPYLSCAMVGWGMVAHFVQILMAWARANLTAGANLAAEVAGAGARNRGPGGRQSLIALGVAAVVVCPILSYVRRPVVERGEVDLAAAGEIPVVYQGRTQPLDSLARSSLRFISDRETFEDRAGEKQPAIRWLLDVISGQEDYLEHRVIRISNLEVLKVLGLERRQRFRYSLEEFREKLGDFDKQVELARNMDESQLSVYHRKILELDRKIRTISLLIEAFRMPALPRLPNEELARSDPPAFRTQLLQFVEAARTARERQTEFNSRFHPPRVVPAVLGEDEEADNADSWQTFSQAWIEAILRQAFGEPHNQATTSIQNILVAYQRGDAKQCNRELAEYRRLLEKERPAHLNRKKVDFEAWFNRAGFFAIAPYLYVTAMALTAIGWIMIALKMGRWGANVAFWVVLLTFVAHSFALGARMYISGRPPVTNLYSSAVFIGWAGVLMLCVIEWITGLGLSTLLAAVAGFATLLIAGRLEVSGDTFTVMQAVLDTQFWLATHVVCITLGYTATFVAGLFGITYVLGGTITPAMSGAPGRIVASITYGVICFAMLFSFVGTVLGGLWADDSWGRFWGWDPKENGALIIVLWNALVLHARWCGLVKHRGLAVLAVVGNIVTAWSWFGVNELGVGLHSYGFTEGVLLSLAIFVLSQLAVIVLGMIPKRLWTSQTTIGPPAKPRPA